MHAHSLLCFGAAPGDGNPALVIEGDHGDVAARQAFARERNTTCVFIDEDGADSTPRVDFFYPHMRSPLCLHATLGVAAVLFARMPYEPTLAVQTAVHGQHLQLSRDGADYFVRIAAQPAPQVDIGDAELAALLQARLDAPGFVPRTRTRVASVGSPKLLVEVADVDALYALRPDLAAIAAWGQAHGVNGLYVWCRRPDGAYEGRNFNHLDPALEDSATGVAAGALALALGGGSAIDLDLRQGRMSGRDCLIRVRRPNHAMQGDAMPGEALLIGGGAAFA
jgi:PhzF family phenazine biosynthesis protein